LSAAEGQKAQLAPNIKRSAELVLSFYGCYALTGAFCFHLAGMQWFDAVNHSLTAVSTGGFSTRLMSIGYWDSPAVEATAMILMLLGGTNFLTSYLLLKRKFSFLKRNGELRLESALLVLSLPLLFWEVTQPIYADLSKALRVALFEAVSALTTTGFSCTAYGQWPDSGCLVLIGLMLIGGGTGSTAGGLKQYRIYILYRGLLWELRRLLLPKQAVTEPDVWHGEERRFISDKDLRQTGMFVFLYFIAFATGSVIIATYGFSLKQALFEFASALGTVGLSLGITAAQAPAGMLWTQIVGMFFGRLEFFAVIVGTVKLVSDMRTILVINKKNAAD
jgi:trk system potassium uptake protein TrkH